MRVWPRCSTDQGVVDVPNRGRLRAISARRGRLRKIRRSPLMAVPATAGGALIGWSVCPIIGSLAFLVLDPDPHGCPGDGFVIYRFLCWVGAVLGGATAFASIMSFGNWRRFAGWLLIFGAVAALVWNAPPAYDCMRADGRRTALAVCGLPMLWACLLGFWGLRMQRQRRTQE